MSVPSTEGNAPKQWALELNEYQAANLVWLLRACGYPYDVIHSVPPFTYANTGDWLGEIYLMIEAQGLPKQRPNYTAERLAEHVKFWKTHS